MGQMCVVFFCVFSVALRKSANWRDSLLSKPIQVKPTNNPFCCNPLSAIVMVGEIRPASECTDALLYQTPRRRLLHQEWPNDLNFKNRPGQTNHVSKNTNRLGLNHTTDQTSLKFSDDKATDIHLDYCKLVHFKLFIVYFETKNARSRKFLSIILNSFDLSANTTNTHDIFGHKY